MDTRIFGLTTGLAVMLAVSTASAGQHDTHQGGTADGQATAQVALCRQAQPGVGAVIDAALKRLEEARQTNSPALMRAAADDLQLALLDVRSQLAPCAEMQVAAADAHAGHATPNVQQAPAGAPGTPVMRPGSATPAPGAVAPATPAPAGADAHADHAAAAATPPSAARQASTSGQQRAQARPANSPTITFRTIPSPPRGAAENDLEVTVKDSQGKPIDGTEVTVLFYMAAMPAMKMPEMRNEVTLEGAGAGRYTGKGQVVMAGAWTVTVSVKQNGKEIGQHKVAISAK